MYIICSNIELMKDRNNNSDHLDILRKIQGNPKISQRKLAQELGFSLGKINYCLLALKSKGLIEAFFGSGISKFILSLSNTL